MHTFLTIYIMSVKKLSSREYRFLRGVRKRALQKLEEEPKVRKLIPMSEAIKRGIKIKK